MTASDLTKERDLRVSTPLWADTPRIGVRSGKTPKDNHYDTIVVGTGISGALVAHSLHRPGRSMLIVDRPARFFVWRKSSPRSIFPAA